MSDSKNLPEDLNGESFLESIEGLAVRQKNISPDKAMVYGTELSNLSIDDFPEVESTEKTDKKIDESEDEPLTVSTIHSAKGLEWHSVIIPHALDGLIPSVRSLNNIEEIEEERRLFYVACSRAKQDLLITMPSYVTTYNAFLSYPSRFLVEISRDKFHYQ